MEPTVSFDLNIDRSQIKENLIFVDSAIENYNNLISATSANSEIVMLDPVRDGILQITEELAQRDDIESIHIVSHGKLGNVQLGNIELNLDTLDYYADELQSWNHALTQEADILLYGCNIGGNQVGEDLINRVSSITGADVAASDDLTGSAALGGDWELEVVTGQIESSLAFSVEARLGYNRVLASDGNMTMMDMMQHQSPLLNLVPHDQATHVAIKNGGWFNPSTWKNGQIPGDNANILIPEGRKVWYGSKSDTRLNTIRVDGTLSFKSGSNSKMLIDTFVVSPDGKLNIGTQNNPVKANKTAQIIFTSDTSVDTTLDPKQFGRGLISHGQVNINGADKLDFVELTKDLSAGDNQLTLNLPNDTTTPSGWQVGDQLVLGGTSYNRKGSDEDNSRFQDEVLTITAIDGNKISFTNNDIISGNNTVLRFDHQRPEGYKNRLNLYVANTTRNVTFETENGEDVPINHRGHVMLMHNPKVAVQNAGFYNLGRTDKNKLIDDPGQNVDGTKGNGTNPRGRYALHFHRTGAGDWNGAAAIAKGNAVVGSPGWGIAHHDSHANIEDNVVFDVVGAGIAAEAGNEIGTWRNNITIKTTGDDRQNKPDLGPTSDRVNMFDFGFNGEGYWVQGAGQINVVDNIAVSASEVGFIHYGGGDGGQKVRDAQTILTKNLLPKYQSIAKATNDESVVDVSAVPIRKFSGFESYNSKKGISFWATTKNVDNQLAIEGTRDIKTAHNFHALANNFKVWQTRSVGVHFAYASQINLKQGLIIGDTNSPEGKGIAGFSASMNHNFENLHFVGFEKAISVPQDNNISWNASQIKNVSFDNNLQNFAARIIENREIASYPNYFRIIDSEFDTVENNQLPIAKFTNKAVGGLAVKFDASASLDRDVNEDNLVGNGIVSYGWDFDNDGNVDDFGSQVSHYFDNAGSHNVTLTVWDNQGATNTLTKEIEIAPKEYDNLIVDSNFTTPLINKDFSSATADRGWSSNHWRIKSNRDNTKAAIVSQFGGNGIGQSILDNRVRRGSQSLSIDLKNTEGNRVMNSVVVTAWGVNGEFTNPNWELEGPQQMGAIPMKKTKLLQQKVGGTSFDWTNYKWDLDFDDGYQFIVLQINTLGVSPRNDFVGVKNIKIT